jgi:hypothetical protein
VDQTSAPLAGLGGATANHLATAQLIELEGSDRPPFTETPDRIVDEVNQFVAGCR